MWWQEKYFKITTKILLFLIIIYLLNHLQFMFTPIKGILSILGIPILISILFYYLLRPAVMFLERKKIPRGLAIALLFISIIGTLTGIVIYSGSFILYEANELYLTFKKQFIDTNQNSTNISIFTQQLTPYISIADLQTRLTELAQFSLTWIGENIGLLGIRVKNIGSQMILTPFILFYLLKDRESFGTNVSKVVPKKYRKDYTLAVREIDEMLSIYIRGQLIVALFIGVFMYIGFLIIGLPNGFILALFTVITSVIPFVGPVIGIIPALFLSFTIDLLMVAKVLILVIIVQQIEGDFISPNVIGNRLKIHPLIIIVIVMVSVSLYGILGAFLAVPAYVICRVIFKRILASSKI